MKQIVPVNKQCFNGNLETRYPGEINLQSVNYTIAENFTSFMDAIVTVYWNPPEGTFLNINH